MNFTQQLCKLSSLDIVPQTQKGGEVIIPPSVVQMNSMLWIFVERSSP